MKMLRAMLVLALPLALLGGCASAGEMETGEAAAGEVTVEVQNDLVPPTSLTVWLVPETGSRNMIGTVSPGSTRTLSTDVSVVTSQFRLLAETTAGQEIVSRPFTLVDATGMVEWDLTANTVTLR